MSEMFFPYVFTLLLVLLSPKSLVQVRAQSIQDIEEIPESCKFPSDDPICPPDGEFSEFSTCGNYQRTKSRGTFCFYLIAQHLTNSCFATKPSLGLSERLHQRCTEQCNYARWKLTRTIKRCKRRKNKRTFIKNLGALISIGSESIAADAVIKETHLLYELKPPLRIKCPSPVPGVPQEGCGRRGRCQCW